MIDWGELAQLGSTLVTVVIFVWYLEKRDRAIQDTLTQLRDVIHELRGRMFGATEEPEEKPVRRVR